MKSVRQLKDILGLDTIHQTRNRIKAVEELIQHYIKRGENNEILVGKEGVEILTKLQDLYESGLLLSEAAEVIQSDYSPDEDIEISMVSAGSESDRTRPDSELLGYLKEEIKFQRQLIVNLMEEEDQGNSHPAGSQKEEQWWLDWI